MPERHVSQRTRSRKASRRFARTRESGMTLLELIIACAVLMVLATAAMPVARYTVKRQKEAELRRDLREIRDAIDRYKDAADRNRIRVEVGTEGYPPDLDTLVKGVDLMPAGNGGLGTGIPGAGIPNAVAPGPNAFPGAAGSTGIGGGIGAGGIGGGIGGGFGNGFGNIPTAGSLGTNGNGATANVVQHVRFLRRIPVDPMTGRAEWGMRSVQDDPDSKSWGGTDVFDVFSLSTDTALDGTKYSDW